ncbi:MAG: TetR/AcrR family transcriptional regulator [Mariprofundaceae bacterium]|nr:TetR/AcrR family transcriptional regulator [Mariprofundaceae bacterium]
MSDKRQIILDTASTLFQAYGYHAVGIDRIIAEAPVAKMTLYKYFPSKDFLITSVLHERNKIFQQSIVEFITRSNNPTDKIRLLFLWHHHWFQESTFNGCMFINAVAEFSELDHSIRQVSIKHKIFIQELIESILSRFPGNVSNQLAAQILQLLDGAIIAAQIAGDSRAAFVAWRSATAILNLNGIAIELNASLEH